MHDASHRRRRAPAGPGRPCLPRVVAFLLALFLPLASQAQGALAPLLLDGQEQARDLHGHFGVLRDPDGRLDVAQLTSRPADFAPAPRDDGRSFGDSAVTVWLRLDLQSRSAVAADWRIEFADPALERVELFDLGDDGLRRQLAGAALPAAQRSLAQRTPLFAVHLVPGERRTLYFRVQSAESPSFAARLWSAERFARHRETGGLLLALYFGMLLALLGYHLLLFLARRERSFLLYAAGVASLGAAVLAASGLGDQYLWPQDGAWSNRILPIGLALANASAAAFVRRCLGSARELPVWHRLLGVSAALHLGLALAALALPVGIVRPLLDLSGTGNLILLLLCGLAGLRRRLPAAPSFVAAGLTLLVGALPQTLRSFGLIAADHFALNALLPCSALALLLFAFGLAQRLDALKRQKRAAQYATLAAQRHSLQALQEQERLLEQRVAERTQALAAANERLRELALKDPLTGLANRMAMRQHLEQAWLRARRREEMLAVLLLDLDGFKPVNDCHGHEAGDRLLVQVARRLQASARTTDLVARLGGDEFVLVCEGIGSEEQAEQLAGRILETLGQPFQLGREEVGIGASIGISFGLGCRSSADLLREADQAMYRAKAAGRNRMDLGRRPAGGATQDQPAAPDER